MSPLISPATDRRSLVTICVLTTSCPRRPAFTSSRQENPAAIFGWPQGGRGRAEASRPLAVPPQSSSRLLPSPERPRLSARTQQRWAEQSIHPFLTLYTPALYNSLISCRLFPTFPLHRSAHRCCVRAPGTAFAAPRCAISSLLTRLEATRLSDIANRAATAGNSRFLRGRGPAGADSEISTRGNTSRRASEEIDATPGDGARRCLLKHARIRKAHRIP